MSQRWIRDYERRKIRNDRQLNESWASSRYNTGDWRQDQNVRLASGLTVGRSWWKLRRLWRKYKIIGREGGYRDDIAYQINCLAVSLDIGRVDLPETADLPDYEFEDQPNSQSEEEEEIEGEDPLYKIFRREEAESERDSGQQEAESEKEDDWFSPDREEIGQQEEVEDLWPDD